MNQPVPDRPRILFLFSDTGGGHRSAAEAIIEALRTDFGARFSTEMVDIFKQYAPPPLNYLPNWYPKMVRLPRAWGAGFHLSNGRNRSQFLITSTWPYIRQSVRKLIAQHPSELIVSVHPLANTPILKALGKKHTPFVTVVTDLVTSHASWFHRQVDLCIVPTQAARQRALKYGLRPEQVRVVGLPVAERFCQPGGDKSQLRARLGWPQDVPVILLVGGGEGMGPLEKTATAIDQARLPFTLVVVTGRNQALKQRLESTSWSSPTFIYGFVHEMPDFMRAADILLSKAGPGTITEGFNAGLPIILYSRLPGQESGNVAFVVSEGAGVWTPSSDQIIATLRRWQENPAMFEAAAQNARRLANPTASHQIARILVQQLEFHTIATTAADTSLP
jgi:1,2-diacylglycerol 3-beta-galactosyltransferase